MHVLAFLALAACNKEPQLVDGTPTDTTPTTTTGSTTGTTAPPADAGDDMASATPIDFTDFEPSASDKIDPAGDRDFFAIDVSAGDVMEIYTVAYAADGDMEPDTVIRVYDPDGNLVAENDDMPYRLQETDSGLYQRADRDGTWFIEVLEWSDWDPDSNGPVGGSTFDYDLYVKNRSLTEMEPNDSDVDAINNAYGWLDVLPTTDMYLGFWGQADQPGDIDLYYWGVGDTYSDSEVLELSLWPGSTNQMVPAITIYDADFNVLATTEDVFPVPEYLAFWDSAIIYNFVAGDYYIEISDSSGASGADTFYAGILTWWGCCNDDVVVVENHYQPDAFSGGVALAMDTSDPTFNYGWALGEVSRDADLSDTIRLDGASVGSLDGRYLTIELQSASVGFQSDLKIVLRDASGTVLGEFTDGFDGRMDPYVENFQVPNTSAIYIDVEIEPGSVGVTLTDQYSMLVMVTDDPL